MGQLATVVEAGAGSLVRGMAADLSDLVTRFLAALDTMPSSREAYRRNLKPFLSWLANRPATPLMKADILAYRSHLESVTERRRVLRDGREVVTPGPLTHLTRVGYMAAVRRFFSWMEEEQLYPNIAGKVRVKRTSGNHEREALTVGDARSLYSSIDRSTLEGKRDHAIINLMGRGGLRTVEVVRARVGDIRSRTDGKGNDRDILMLHGKGRSSADAFVPLSKVALIAIREYLAGRGPVADTDPLFCSHSDRNHGGMLTPRTVSLIVKAHLRALGINNSRLSAHSLRHSAATHLLIAGGSLQEAQAYLRHKNIATTMVYAHNLDLVSSGSEDKIDALLAGAV